MSKQEQNDKKKLIDSFIDITEQNNYKEIFEILLDSTKDLELKSHIINPLALASLQFYSYALKVYGFKKSHEITKYLIKMYLKNMIGYKRLGRSEIFNTLAFNPNTNENELSLKEKLIKNAKKL